MVAVVLFFPSEIDTLKVLGIMLPGHSSGSNPIFIFLTISNLISPYTNTAHVSADIYYVK